MKKCLATALAFLLLFTACGSGGDSSPVSIDPTSAAQTILDKVEFQDSLVELDDSSIEAYYRLDDSVTAYTVYVSGTRATAEEIAVLQAQDGDLTGAKAAIDKRIDNLKFEYENYVPKELTKLNDPVIVEKGNTVILVLADDTAAAKAVVEELFK